MSINMFLSTFIVLGTLNVAQAATFRIYTGSMDNYTETDINNPYPLLSYIDKSKNTTFYAGGVQNSATGPAISRMVSTYIALNNNVILLNWEKESSLLPGLLAFPLAVAAAKVIAPTCAASIVELIKEGVLASKINLVGHSLGAHLMGWIGGEVLKRNHILFSIWGLDASILVDGLNPSQAQNVNTVITNPGHLGTDQPAGKINFWVNCGNNGLQPGCPVGLYPPLSEEGRCSHDRAWMIMSEALLNPGSFPAVLAENCNEWKSQTSSNAVINYLGNDFDPSKTGVFYLSTNSKSPYSKGEAGEKPNQ